MPEDKKPPLGPLADWAWREQRVIALSEAIRKYVSEGWADRECVGEWASEISDHLWFLRDRKTEMERAELVGEVGRDSVISMSPVEMTPGWVAQEFINDLKNGGPNG